MGAWVAVGGSARPRWAMRAASARPPAYTTNVLRALAAAREIVLMSGARLRDESGVRDLLLEVDGRSLERRMSQLKRR